MIAADHLHLPLLDADPHCQHIKQVVVALDRALLLVLLEVVEDLVLRQLDCRHEEGVTVALARVRVRAALIRGQGRGQGRGRDPGRDQDPDRARFPALVHAPGRLCLDDALDLVLTLHARDHAPGQLAGPGQVRGRGRGPDLGPCQGPGLVLALVLTRHPESECRSRLNLHQNPRVRLEGVVVPGAVVSA